jgi:hypothetical protein
MEEFLKQFLFGGLIEVAIGKPANRRFLSAVEPLPTDTDVFFGPAMRKTPGGEKTDVLGSRALWVDVDDPAKPLFTMPPSAVVFSGHGWHLYWFLKEPLLDLEQLETLNKLLAQDVQNGDPACWNCNRVLRVPGSMNTKSDPVPVTTKIFTPNLVYSPDDFRILESLNKAERHRIRTGDVRGFRSRSERDWQIVTALTAAGAEDSLIERIFNNQPCGDKHRQSEATYLSHTISKVREKGPVHGRATTAATDIVTGLEERDDGYYIVTRRGQRRISTFVIEPTLLLDGTSFEAEDAIVGSVAASGYKWPDKTFSRSAFTSVAKMDKETPTAAWQFLGHDDDLRLLLPYLLERLQTKGLPKVSATPTMGLHVVKGRYVFVGDKQVLGAEQLWEGFKGPIAWLPSKKEHPELEFTAVPEVARDVGYFLPRLNVPDVIWPLIGWYAASCMKPWFEAHQYRFPILNVAGTKGSGKTTIIQRVFMPAFGQTECKSYDANTTRFVVLALLGSSNAVPVAFSEFRYDSAEKFIRYVLLAYDTGHDPRGRSDQTTIDYPLSAPFSIDGEDLVEDPAARERVVVAFLKRSDVAEGTECFVAYEELEDKSTELEHFALDGFAGYYIQECLKRIEDGRALKMLYAAKSSMFEAFPARMPDRVRSNHIVAYFGALMFCDITGIEPPNASVMSKSINSVYDVGSEHSRTLIDSMVEDIVNSCSGGSTSFKWVYGKSENVLYFQLASAHSWWMASRRRQGRGALERDAIRAQLKEAPYTLDAKVLNSTWMYGIDLTKAQQAGLDIPNMMNVQEITVRLS